MLFKLQNKISDSILGIVKGNRHFYYSSSAGGAVAVSASPEKTATNNFVAFIKHVSGWVLNVTHQWGLKIDDCD